ncbi:recombinase RecT [Micromonospora sp. NPDC049366]|uniref:recombinase RecT n=1 Tax=Micromonospora sp. NPDC049366 TaxID=3364271 RepID=UPI0037ACC91E
MSQERINPAANPTTSERADAGGGAPTLAQAIMPRPRFDVAEKKIIIPTPFEGGFLEFDPDAEKLTKEQVVILAPARIKADYSPAYVMAFLADCHRRGLDPWSGEAYLMRYAGEYVRHIGIAGFLRIAEETGQFRGVAQVLYQGEGEDKWREVWPFKDAAPFAAKATTYRANHEPSTVVALYDEYAPLEEEKTRVQTGPSEWRRVPTGNGKVPTPMWQPASKGGKPTVMLGKCGKSAALRQQFPHKFVGYYEPAELEKAAEGIRDWTGGEVAEQRRAAYAAAQAASVGHLGQTVDGADVGATVRETITVTSTTGDPADAGRGRAEAEVRALLLAELDAQARLLGKDRAWMTRRWSEARGGQAFETATVPTMTGHVHRYREYVVGRLRETGRNDLAVRYAAAPLVGTLEELFGTAEPWADDPGDQADQGGDGGKRRCRECGDEVTYLSSGDLCDGCVEEQAIAADADRETVGVSA